MTYEKKTKKNIDINLLNENGKLPPQSIELEQAILGALMLEKDALTNIIDLNLLKPEVFYKESHSIIFSAIQELFERSEPVDILTVTQEIRKNNKIDTVGGIYYITQLTNRVASAANVEFHSRIVFQKYIQRKLIEFSAFVNSVAYEESGDIFEMISNTENQLSSITSFMNFGKIDIVKDVWTSLKERNKILVEANRNQNYIGVMSGFSDIDRVTGGFQKSDFILIAARPAMGKTSFLLNLVRNSAVEFDNKILFFSIEMSAVQLAQRAFSAESDISLSKFLKEGITDIEIQNIETKYSKLINSKIFIDDNPSITLTALRAKSRKMKREHDIKMIVIDYLQIVAVEDTRMIREQQVSMIARKLKQLARELNIPIIALAQLSRSNEQRGGDKKPQLSDLRESGSLEQEADLVAFIHRPEYYGVKEYEGGKSTQGIAEFIIAKHRNGSVGTEYLRFIPNLTKFSDLETNYFEDEVIDNSKNINIWNKPMKNNDDFFDDNPF